MKRTILLTMMILFICVNTFASEGSIIFLKYPVGYQVQKLKKDMSNRPMILREMKSGAEKSLNMFMTKVGNRFNIENFLWSVNAIVVKDDINITKSLESMPEVLYILPDIIEYPEEPVSKDTPIIETSSDDLTYGLKNMNVQKVWDELGIKGQGINVGIIDTGIDGNHPEFKGTKKVISYWEPGGNTSLDNMTDGHGHGSHVAGTIAGGTISGKHIGVAPEAKLIIAKGISSKGTRASYLLEAMEHMIDPDGNPDTADFPRAINCSWHSGYGDQTPYYAMLERWIDTGIIPCFSAGNSGPGASTITKPKEFPALIATAALDSNKKVASFSSRGPAIFKGMNIDKPDVASPGVDVYSVKAGGGYRTMSGTSMASPHTTGVVALILSANPALTIDDVRQILYASCHDAGDEGYDYSYGHGWLDAYTAVKLAKNGGFVSGSVNVSGVAVSITVKETGTTYRCNKDGDYKFMLPSGSYTLIASAYGYLPKEQTVTVYSSQTSDCDFYLSEAQKIEISGKVVNKDNEPIKATVIINEVEGVSADTDNFGEFELELVAGLYSLTVKAYGYETLVIEKTNYSYNTDLDISLEALPPVLVVDNSKSSDNLINYYSQALQDLGIDFNCHNTDKDGDVSEDILMPYNMVIWFTGGKTSDTVDDNDSAILEKYLNSGGSLFITGQDIGYNIKTKAFYKDMLKAKYIKDKADTRIVRSDTISFAIEDGDGADNQKYPDVIEPEGSQVLFDYKDDGAAALYYVGDYKVVYFGFGFEAISTQQNRKDVMGIVIDTIYPDLETRIKRLATLKEMYKETLTNIVEDYTSLLEKEIYEEGIDPFNLNKIDLPEELKEAMINR